MNIVEELRQLSKDYKTKELEVIVEISNYFKEYLDSEQFIIYLKNNAKEKEIKEREFRINVRFWEYRDGCSPTHFAVGNKEWKIPSEEKNNDETKYYKDIRLKNIQNQVCNNIKRDLESKMKELGFSYLTYEKKSNALDLEDTYYTFGW